MQVSKREILESVPYVNEAAQITRNSEGHALVEVPLRRPRYMVPPLSWLVRFSERRRLALDPLGAAILGMVNGQRTTAQIIEAFAVENKLRFREAQTPVLQFLGMLLQRGVVAVAGRNREQSA